MGSHKKAGNRIDCIALSFLHVRANLDLLMVMIFCAKSCAKFITKVQPLPLRVKVMISGIKHTLSILSALQHAVVLRKITDFLCIQ